MSGHGRRLRKRGLLIGGSGLIASAVTPASQVAGSDIAAEPSPPVVEIADREYIPSVVDVEKPSDVIDRAMALLGDTYVDLSISDDAEAFVIGVYQVPESAFAELSSSLTRVAPIRLESRPVGRPVLDALRAQLETEIVEKAERSDLGLAPGQVNEVYTDYLEGVVSLGVPSAEQIDIVASVLAEAGFDMKLIRIQVVLSQSQDSAVSTPYKAGKQVGVGNAIYTCTTGFTIKNDFGYFGLTAAHCNPFLGYSTFLFGIFPYTYITSNLVNQGQVAVADAMAYPINTGHVTDDLYRSSTITRDVSALRPESQTTSNLTVCTRGAVTADQLCGPITQRDVTRYISDPTLPFPFYVQNQYCWSFPSGEQTSTGDSGAPVYRVLSDESVEAVGVHQGRRSSDANITGCFSHLEPVLYAMNSSLHK